MTWAAIARGVVVTCLLALVGCGDGISLPSQLPRSPAVGAAAPTEIDETAESGGPPLVASVEGEQTDSDPAARPADLALQGLSGVPNWMATGTRITWYAAAASVAQSCFSITEDPTCSAGGHGCYTDPQTGKFYRKSDEGPDAQGAPTASGDGFSQLDVMAVDGRNVALMSNLYVIDRNFNQLGWTPLGGATVDATSLDGSWMPPSELEQAVATGIGGLLVLTGEYQLAERVVPSVSFVTGLGGGNRTPSPTSSCSSRTAAPRLMAPRSSSSRAGCPASKPARHST